MSRIGKRLVLLGAGGAGRETLAFIRGSSAYLATHSIDQIVFVDDGVPTHEAAPVVATMTDYRPLVDDLVLCTVNDTGSRRSITTEFSRRGAHFTTFVHPTAVIGERVTLGEGAVVYPHCTLSADIEIGRHAFLNTAVAVGHDVVVGDHVTVGGYSQLLGGAEVGDEAWFGTSATILPGASIGARARVGAGSVVLRRAKPDTTVFGNPARPIS